MTHSARILFLVKDLLDELHSEKIELGTGAHLRVQELLRHLPDELSEDDLLLAIAPILSHSPQDQALVYEKFRICQQRADEIFGKTPEPPPPPPDPINEKIRRSKFWFWVSAAVLALVLGGLAWVYFQQEDKAVVEKSLAVTAGQTTQICPSIVPELDTFGQKVSGLTIKFADGSSELQRYNPYGGVSEGIPASAEPTVVSNWAVIRVQKDTCLSYTARDSVQGMDSLVLHISFSNGKTCELRLRIFVSLPAEVPKKTVIADPEIPNFQTRPIPFDHTQAFLNLVVKSADPWQIWLAQNWVWLRWLIFLPFTALLFALWRWLEWRRRKLIAELDRPDKPPYVWNIRIDGADDIVLGDAFQHALQVMRRRSATDTLRLDLPRSIRATAEKGGMPAFQFRAQTQPVDYLLLIDRQSAQNHRAQLFDAVFRALQAQELHIERFFYDSDIRVGFNEAHPDGLRLADISQRYGQARLIVVGTGLQLIHPANARLEAWVDVFKNWPSRALFTPKPTDDWGRAERRLSELFTLFPATLQSLGFWVEELEHGEDARFERWRERVQDAPAAIYQPDDEYPLPMLLLQLPRELVRWVASCAIYPSLHWDLTLWLGRSLSKSSRLGKSGTEADAEPTVNLDSLLKIFRIRWFVQGQIPQTARTALLEWLEKEDAALILRLRSELAALLAQSPPPLDAVAWADHRMAVVLNQWLSETDQKKKKALEKEIEKLLPQTEADFTVLKYLDRPPSPLHFLVPDRWKKFVYRGGFRALGFSGGVWSTLGAGLLWLLGAWGIFTWTPWPPEDGCKGEKLEYMFKPRAGIQLPESLIPTKSGSGSSVQGTTLALCLDSPEDSLLWLERQMFDIIEAGDFARIDTFNKEYSGPKKISSPLEPPRTKFDTISREINPNLAAAIYNKGVFYYRKNLRDSACICFNFMSGARRPFIQSYPYFDQGINWCKFQDPATSRVPKTQLQILEYPEVGRMVHFLVLNPEPNIVYELQPEDGSPRQKIKNGTFQHTYQRPGIAHVLLLANGKLIETRDLIVAYAPKIPATSPLIDDGGTPSDATMLGSDSESPPSTPTTPLSLPEMLPVKGGTFTMGSPQSEEGRFDNELQHPVTLSDFEMGKTEVTVAQYMAFVNETKTHYPEWLEAGSDYNINTGTDDHYKKMGAALQAPNHPIVGISWNDAVAYCEWLSQKVPGRKFRLPTEAEWEYTARGGRNKKSDFKYAGSDNIDAVAWYTENTKDSRTRPVATKKENDLGLYDMSGNVWEWCADWFGTYEDAGKPISNPKGPATGSYRVYRGGSWLNYAGNCRVSHRYYNTPEIRYSNIGFRLASSPQ